MSCTSFTGPSRVLASKSLHDSLSAINLGVPPLQDWQAAMIAAECSVECNSDHLSQENPHATFVLIACCLV